MRRPNFPSQIRIISFDIFDTVITRNLYRPHDIFARVKERLICSNELSTRIIPLLDKLDANRILAERTARLDLEVEREETTFNDIIILLTQRMGLPAETAHLIAAFEIEEEIKSVVPVESVVSLVKEMRQSGKDIIFVSDMYLPEDVIRKMLMRVGVLNLEDRLYVSSSIGKKKSTGSLFRHIMGDIGIRSGEIIHIGDYLWSDYLQPRLKNGIRSMPVRIVRDNVYEHLWGEPCRCLYCSSVAGASRAARVARTGEDIGIALYNLGCNVLGPILTAFTLWVLRQAVQSGVQRIYFLSRDGDVMLDVAREIAGRSGIILDLRYLYVSRTAVFPALLNDVTDARSLEWLKEDNIVLTTRIIADRLKVEVTRLHEQLIRSDINLSGPDTPLDRKLVEQICCLLTTDPILREMVSESGRDAFQALAGYLGQEGLFDGTSFAIVDLGWHGSIQDAIYNCFKERFGDNDICGYYFGVDRGGEHTNRKMGFFFDPDEVSEITRYQHLFRVLLEVMCSGRHGMVHHYYLSAQGKYDPICRANEHPINTDSVEHIRHGVSTYLRCLDISGIGIVDFYHIKPQILSVLKKLFFYPSREEATALGEFRFSADQAGHGVHIMAPPFTFGMALRYATKASYAGRSRVSSWLFASWVRSGCIVRTLLYPPIVLLRIFYIGPEMLRFGKMRVMDALNKLIGVYLGLAK